MEVYVGAAGKVLLAHTSNEVRNYIIKKGRLRKLTSKTITNAERLEAELEITKHQGYAISEGERYKDVVSIAAPIFDYHKRVCAAIAITGPKDRLGKTVIRRYIKIVVKVARNLSNQLVFFRRDIDVPKM